jgi:hypothetical protein
MPSTIPNKTTLELWEIVKNPTHADRLAAIAEIEGYRIITEENKVTGEDDLVGFVRPTRPNL